MDFSNFSPALVLVTVVALALAPFVAVMVTSFTKIVVVLSLLRNALGLQQVPPNVVINGLAIVLSIYVMYPVILDTTAAVNGLPPVTASAAAQAAPAQAAPAQAPPAGTPATATAPAQTVPPTRPAPSATTASDDPPPASPAAADARRAEAQAQAAAANGGRRGPLFANVQGSPDALPPPAEPGPAASDAAPAPGSTAARTRVVVPAQPPATRISELSLTGGGTLTMDRLLAMIEAGKEPLRKFLIQHSSDAERAFFLRSAQRLLPPASRDEITVNDFIVVIPAFTVSELTAAFQIGFLIYLPFLIIDLVVSNILLALGMMMMSPTTVSLPFKLLLFVLIDGWAKLVHGLVLTYG